MRTGNTRIFPMVAILGLFMASMALAAPDFSGTWVLNTDKGENLGMVKAIQETVVIRQTADAFEADFSSTFQGDTTERQIRYDLAGKNVPNEGAMGEQAETVAKWDGNKLLVTWTTEGAVAGTKVVKTETRSLSADGKEMTVTNQRPNRPPMVMVYDRK